MSYQIGTLIHIRRENAFLRPLQTLLRRQACAGMQASSKIECIQVYPISFANSAEGNEKASGLKDADLLELPRPHWSYIRDVRYGPQEHLHEKYQRR